MNKTVHKPPENFQPKYVILIHGKRKSGKDYFLHMLLSRLDKDDVAVMHIANPIKHYWAVKNNLSYERLLDTSSYKEEHRFKMVEWSQEVRQDNYGYFNVEAIKMAAAELSMDRRIWICSDVRHKEDYQWFHDFIHPSKLKKVRVRANLEVRITRGWINTPGIDDGPSETDLDDIEDSDWDLVVHNNGQSSGDQHVEEALQTIQTWISSSL